MPHLCLGCTPPKFDSSTLTVARPVSEESSSLFIFFFSHHVRACSLNITQM